MLTAKKNDTTNLFIIVIKQIARFNYFPFMLTAMIDVGNCDDGSAND